MANSFSVAFFRSAQLALTPTSIKRTTLPLLGLTPTSIKRTTLPLLGLALSLALAFLLLRLLPTVLSLLVPLSAGPIFLYANLLIVAIVFSSSSSAPSHRHSLLPSSPPCDSYDISHYYTASESASQRVPRYRSPKSAPQWKKQQHLQPQRLIPGSELLVSDCRSTHLAGVRPPSYRKSAIVRISSQPILAEISPSTPLEPLALVPDQGTNQLAIAPRPPKQQREKKLALKQPGPEEHGAASWTGARIIRSKSDQRICDPAATPMKTLRRAETMDEASMVLRAHCGETSPSSNVMDVPPIESLSDEELNKRCAEFIAKSHAKMKKESLECTD